MEKRFPETPSAVYCGFRYPMNRKLRARFMGLFVGRDCWRRGLKRRCDKHLDTSLLTALTAEEGQWHPVDVDLSLDLIACNRGRVWSESVGAAGREDVIEGAHQFVTEGAHN